MQPDTTPDLGAQPIPVISVRNAEAEDWFAVYSALSRHAVADPELARDPYIEQARKLAYDRFNAAFEVL